MMAILYDVPEGSTATIEGPAELRVKASSPTSRYQLYDTAGPAAPVPVIDSITPTEAVLPDPATVDIAGNGFASTVVVVFDGAEVATSYISDTQLQATVTAAAAGGYPLLVRDGAVDSNAATFTFTDPVQRRTQHVIPDRSTRR